MMDADGATKVQDLEKLEDQVGFGYNFATIRKLPVCRFYVFYHTLIRWSIWWCASQILAVARNERRFGGSVASDATLKISDVPIAALGSRAHLEKNALATVEFCYFHLHDFLSFL